jgi:hypothetical protein
MASHEWAPVPRCCTQHGDVEELRMHLVRDFPELSAADVLSQVMAASRAVNDFRINAEDRLETIEIVCRYQLSMLAGRFDDVARLDPQSHARRSRQQPCTTRPGHDVLTRPPSAERWASAG